MLSEGVFVDVETFLRVDCYLGSSAQCGFLRCSLNLFKKLFYPLDNFLTVIVGEDGVNWPHGVKWPPPPVRHLTKVNEMTVVSGHLSSLEVTRSKI